MHDTNGILQTQSAGILRTFTEHMGWKYDHIQINEESIRRMAACGLKMIPPTANSALEEPMNLEEVLLAVKKGKANKSPRRDGMA